MEPEKKLEVNVVVVKEGDWYVAVCLEYFIATQTKSLERIEDALAQAFVANYLQAKKTGHEPFWNLKPAPQRYRDAFEKATQRSTRDLGQAGVIQFRAHVRKAAA